MNPCEVSLNSPNEVEEKPNIRVLNKGKATGLDELSPMFSNLDGEALIKALPFLTRNIWKRERIPLSCGESLTVLSFKNDTHND